MLRGRYEHTIDAKGRISIPSKFREVLNKKYDDRLVISHYDQCLVAYPFEEWTFLEEKQKLLPQMKKETKTYLRFFYSSGAGIAHRLNKSAFSYPRPIGIMQTPSKKRLSWWVQAPGLKSGIKQKWEEEFRKAQESFDQSGTPTSLGF